MIYKNPCKILDEETEGKGGEITYPKVTHACIAGMEFTLRQPVYRAVHEWLVALSRQVKPAECHLTVTHKSQDWNVGALSLYLRETPMVSSAWKLQNHTCY